MIKPAPTAMAALSPIRLDSLLSLTRELLGCAQAGDWERAMALESERRPLIRAAFTTEKPAGCDAERQAVIREILDTDQMVMALARRQRDDLQAQLRELGQGRSALHAYGQHQK